MTEEECLLARELSISSFPFYSYEETFARQMMSMATAFEPLITEKQAEYMRVLASREMRKRANR